MGAPPFLDLIIPTHTQARPIRRAVLSAIEGMSPEDLRVTVVCHNITAERIALKLGEVEPEMVRLVEYSDGMGSPSGPMNEGIRNASGRYIAIMGSDDFFEPLSLRVLITFAKAHNSDVVLARLRYQDAEILHNPLVRPFRTRNLSAVRDRLFYRSAPLGLIRRGLLSSPGAQFVEGMQAGGDQAVSVRLWASASRIDMPANAPCYVIGADADDRVTMETRSIATIMEALIHLLNQEWVGKLPDQVRRAFGVKLLRVNLLGVMNARRTTARWAEEDRKCMRDIFERVTSVCPGSLAPLARADRRLLDVLKSEKFGAAEFVQAVDARQSASRLSLLLPRNPFYLFHRESTLVRYLLYRVGRNK